MKAKLIVVGGTTSTTEVNLRLPTVIGRGRSVQVTIPHSLVSRRHCEITAVEGRLLVRDLDSMNGTYIGNERISEAVLEPGALLTVGTVTFRAQYEVSCNGDGQQDDDSQGDDSDDSCCLEPSGSKANRSTDTDHVPGADSETVPVTAGSFNDARCFHRACRMPMKRRMKRGPNRSPIAAKSRR